MSDVQLLADQFEKFAPSQVIGLAPYLAPFYKDLLEKSLYFHNHPSSRLGEPGPTQGYNAGVVLFNLHAMRNSKEYEKELSPDNVRYLLAEYNIPKTLGAEGWYSMLGFRGSSFIFPLGCQFNAQTDLFLLQPRWLETFHLYHFCDNISNIKIVHNTGCGPTPMDCDHDFIHSKYYQRFIFSFVEIMDIDLFWIVISRHQN